MKPQTDESLFMFTLYPVIFVVIHEASLEQEALGRHILKAAKCGFWEASESCLVNSNNFMIRS
jgi:hypothetical protein